MISNSETASKISELMLEIFNRVNESVAIVKETCTVEEAAAYRKAAGRVAGPIVMEVLGPLYDKHPSLRPQNWDD